MFFDHDSKRILSVELYDFNYAGQKYLEMSDYFELNCRFFENALITSRKNALPVEI